MESKVSTNPHAQQAVPLRSEGAAALKEERCEIFLVDTSANENCTLVADPTRVVWAGVQSRWFCRPRSEVADEDYEDYQAIICPLPWLVEVELTHQQIVNSLERLQQEGLLRYKVIATTKAQRFFVRITDVQIEQPVQQALEAFEVWMQLGVAHNIFEDLGSDDRGLSHFDAALATVVDC